MNCECFYTAGSLDAARALAKEIDQIAIAQGEEAYPVAICRAIKSFSGTSDYCNHEKPFEVKEGAMLVAVCGKDYSFDRIKPNNSRKLFPNLKKHKDMLMHFREYIEDVEAVE